MYQSLDKRVWFTIIFLPLKESLTLFQIWIFYYIFTYFVPFGVIKNRVTKVNSNYFNGNYAEAWILCIYVSWITYILLRQVVSLKKIVVLSAKFTIVILWSLICIPLTHISPVSHICDMYVYALFKPYCSLKLAGFCFLTVKHMLNILFT